MSPILTLRPLGAVSNETASYLGHANYIRAFASLAGFTLPTASVGQSLAALQPRVVQSSTLSQNQNSRADTDQVKRSLANAWGTELILSLSGEFIEEDELMRLANNWAVVQAYYVLYHATQALAVAKGIRRPTNHGATQRLYADFWLKSRSDLIPWTLGFGDDGCVNLPNGTVTDNSINAWSRCNSETRWSLASQALRTTREDAVKKALKGRREAQQSQLRKTWYQKERERLAAGQQPRATPTFPLPRLGPSERREAEAKVRPYGMIDYFYRLRIKTNYVDSAMFTDGPQDVVSARNVHHDLRNLVTGTMLVTELHISHLVGVNQLHRWVDQWLTSNSVPNKKLGLASRRVLL